MPTIIAELKKQVEAAVNQEIDLNIQSSSDSRMDDPIFHRQLIIAIDDICERCARTHEKEAIDDFTLGLIRQQRTVDLSLMSQCTPQKLTRLDRDILEYERLLGNLQTEAVNHRHFVAIQSDEMHHQTCLNQLEPRIRARKTKIKELKESRTLYSNLEKRLQSSAIVTVDTTPQRVLDSDDDLISRCLSEIDIRKIDTYRKQFQQIYVEQLILLKAYFQQQYVSLLIQRKALSSATVEEMISKVNHIVQPIFCDLKSEALHQKLIQLQQQYVKTQLEMNQLQSQIDLRPRFVQQSMQSLYLAEYYRKVSKIFRFSSFVLPMIGLFLVGAFLVGLGSVVIILLGVATLPLSLGSMELSRYLNRKESESFSEQYRLNALVKEIDTRYATEKVTKMRELGSNTEEQRTITKDIESIQSVSSQADRSLAMDHCPAAPNDMDGDERRLTV